MSRWSRYARYILFCVCFVVGWMALKYAGFFDGRWPSILSVFLVFAHDWRAILDATVRTVSQVFVATAFGITIGVPLGVLFAETKWRISGIYGLLAALKAVPVTVLLPVFLVLFGLEHFIVPMVSFPLALNFCINTTQAVAQVSQTRWRLLNSWSISYVTYLRHVLPFECLDSVLQTARVMLPFAVALHIALDYFLTVPRGLGYYVYFAHTHYAYDRMFAGIIAAGLIGLCLGAVVDATARRMLKWKRVM